MEDLAPLDAVQLDLFDRSAQGFRLEAITAALEAKFGHQGGAPRALAADPAPGARAERLGASMTKVLQRRIRVQTHRGQPALLTWEGAQVVVQEVLEQWEEAGLWWEGESPGGSIA